MTPQPISPWADCPLRFHPLREDSLPGRNEPYQGDKLISCLVQYDLILISWNHISELLELYWNEPVITGWLLCAR